jgi:hypothetical protein
MYLVLNIISIVNIILECVPSSYYLHLFENKANVGRFSCCAPIILLYHEDIAENEALLVISYTSIIA